MAPGIDNAYCEDTRTLRVILSDAPALYGPKNVLQRSAWILYITDGYTARIGAPYMDPSEATHVLIPVDVPWPANTLVGIEVVAETAAGVAYTDPDVLGFAGLPESEPIHVRAVGRPPRDDLATDEADGGLVIKGGTYTHHWGRKQMRKVILRMLTDREPRGLGIRKDEPVTQARLAYYRARAREIVASQEGIQAVRADVQFDRATDILRILVDVRTPEGWETYTAELGTAGWVLIGHAKARPSW